VSLARGLRLGPYEITVPLGAGGMGEVYRAHDSTLHRDVAIKVLPEALEKDAERLARFKREAQVLASLNHPSIAHVYGFESATLPDGPVVHFLAMELVEGEDLAVRLKRGPTPVDEVVAIARQIAEGLEEAHEHGVIHRDLKPANIKVTLDGKVKILDFGLAKALEADPMASASNPQLSHSPTLSRHATETGMILGTAAYMSPEQARGKAVDKRADIWAFGVVLFEMLTGTRLFAGETVSDTLAAVLREDVPWSRLPGDAPRKLVHVLRRCLTRDPHDRLRDIGEARLELAAPEPEKGLPAEYRVPAPRSEWWRPLTWMWAVTTLGLAIALVLVWAPWRSGAPLRGSALRFTPFSFEPGGQLNPVWSPGGKAVAFAARQKETDPFQVYVRYLDSPVATAITHVGEDAIPVGWTSAGRIVFTSSQAPAGFWSVSPVGGEPVPLLAHELAGGDYSRSAVSRDGTALALLYRDDDGAWDIGISSPPGAAPRPYQPAPFASHRFWDHPMVKFSPNGKQILLFWNPHNTGNEAWLMPYPADAAHPPHRTFEGLPAFEGTPTFAWMPDSRHVVLSTGQLYMGDTVSGAFAVFSSGTTRYVLPAVSPDGSRLAFVERSIDCDIVSVDLATAAVTPLITTQRSEEMPAWAAREPALAYVSDRNGEQEIWLHKPGQSDRPLVTARDFPAGTTQWFMAPGLSPDAARVIYLRIGRDTPGRLWMSAVTGGAPVPVVKGSAGSEFPGSWSPDGNWYVYWQTHDDQVSLARVKTTGEAEPEVLRPNVKPTKGWIPVWSPSGDWILHDDGGVKLMSPDGKTTRELSSASAVAYAFSADGRTLYGLRKLADDRLELFSTSVAGGAEKKIGTLGPEYLPGNSLGPAVRLSLSPDGKSIAYSTLKRTSNLWLMDGLDSVTPR
jgi:eukaryotic-like serine/threonine-protein kinase